MNLNHIVFFKSKSIKFTRKLFIQLSSITIGIRIFSTFHVGTYRTIRGHLITAFIALRPPPPLRRLRADKHSGQSGQHPLLLCDSFYRITWVLIALYIRGHRQLLADTMFLQSRPSVACERSLERHALFGGAVISGCFWYFSGWNLGHIWEACTPLLGCIFRKTLGAVFGNYQKLRKKVVSSQHLAQEAATDLRLEKARFAWREESEANGEMLSKDCFLVVASWRCYEPITIQATEADDFHILDSWCWDSRCWPSPALRQNCFSVQH
jgi:hypothetical protein